jgi:2-amino-4-hydroxy-6-hydroxymethyldihydropteridine diphosphokinase
MSAMGQAAERIAYVGLGSNLGDRARQLQRALEQLARVIEVCRVSSLYESEPVGPVREQPAFFNAVAEVRSRCEPVALLGHCLEVERRMGRRRTRAKGPRTIDLDLLLVGDLVGSWTELELPHPEIVHRAFVLHPLLELRAELVDPRDGRPLAWRRRAVRDQWLRRLGPVEGPFPDAASLAAGVTSRCG